MEECVKISVLKGGFLSSGYLNFISKCGLPEGISIVYNVNLNMGTRIKSSANVNWSNSQPNDRVEKTGRYSIYLQCESVD